MRGEVSKLESELCLLDNMKTNTLNSFKKTTSKLIAVVRNRLPDGDGAEIEEKTV